MTATGQDIGRDQVARLMKAGGLEWVQSEKFGIADATYPPVDVLGDRIGRF
jgi:hypothetical protein